MTGREVMIKIYYQRFAYAGGRSPSGKL